MTNLLLKVALNTIKQTNKQYIYIYPLILLIFYLYIIYQTYQEIWLST
jgi:uncharacterized membrane protein